MRRVISGWAAALIGAAALLTLSRDALAFEPEAMPEPIGWRRASPFSLALTPLRALRDPSVASTDAEWSPLYSGPDGARVEGARQSLQIRTPPAAWRAGIELDARTGTVRAGEDSPWLGAERTASTLSALGIAREGLRHGVAGAVLHDHGTFGYAAEARTTIGTRTEASVRWSRVPQSARMEARWDDERVIAASRWIDQRVAWRLDVPFRRGAFGFEQEAIDRRGLVPESDVAGDRFEPGLAWRASMLDVSLVGGGARWSMDLRYGQGREEARIRRGTATAYALARGQVLNGLASLRYEPLASPLSVRAWAGRWSGDLRAAVSLWAFDPLAYLTGTRLVALSSGSLEHQGLSIDRIAPGVLGLDGGLAVCRVAPRASYRSWQADLFGLGHSNESSGDASIDAAWLAGVRIASTVRAFGIGARLELVQWVPVRIERGPSDETPGTGGGDGGGAPSVENGGERGGTVVRVSLRALPGAPK